MSHVSESSEHGSPSEHEGAQETEGNEHEREGDSLPCDGSQKHSDQDRDDRNDDAFAKARPDPTQRDDHQPANREPNGERPRCRGDARKTHAVVMDGSSDDNEHQDGQQVEDEPANTHHPVGR